MYVYINMYRLTVSSRSCSTGRRSPTSSYRRSRKSCVYVCVFMCVLFLSFILSLPSLSSWFLSDIVLYAHLAFHRPYARVQIVCMLEALDSAALLETHNEPKSRVSEL